MDIRDPKSGKIITVLSSVLFARSLRVSRQRVYQYMEMGMPTIPFENGYGSFVDVKKATAWLKKNCPRRKAFQGYYHTVVNER